MNVLHPSRDMLEPLIAPPRPFSLRIFETTTALPWVTVVPDAISKTEVHLPAGHQLRLDQAWFWTPEWQAMEREADDDLAAGRYEDFETFDDFIEGLERLIKE
jgi:hypothetical protein